MCSSDLASQRAIGTGVLGGMFTGTVLAVIFVPIFFVVIRRIFKPRSHRPDPAASTAAALEQPASTSADASAAPSSSPGAKS